MDKVSILVGIIVNKLVQIAGLKGRVARFIIKHGGRFLYDFIMNWYRKLKRKSEQTVAKEEFDKVVENPKSTVQERGEAYEKYINSGRN